MTAQAARGREDAADDDVDRGDIELGDMEEGDVEKGDIEQGGRAEGSASAADAVGVPGNGAAAPDGLRLRKMASSAVLTAAAKFQAPNRLKKQNVLAVERNKEGWSTQGQTGEEAEAHGWQEEFE